MRREQADFAGIGLFWWHPLFWWRRGGGCGAVCGDGDGVRWRRGGGVGGGGGGGDAATGAAAARGWHPVS